MADVKFIITTDETSAVKGIKNVGDALGETEKKAVSAGDKIRQYGEKASRVGKNMSLYVTAPLLAAGGAAIKMAMDAVESENLFEVSMGDMAGAARDWSIEMRDQFGLNQFEIRKTVGTMDVMLKSMGLNEEAAFDMSKGLVQLTYDMASFYNLKPEEAFQKLQSGISGEVEPLKRLGILVNENTIKQYALKTGLIKSGEQLDEQQKILARYGAIMEQTTAAQGDMARTLDSPANKLRILKSRMEETSIELGTKLLPLFEKGMDIVGGLVEKFSNLSDEKQELILKMGGLLIAAGPALTILGKFATLFPVIASGAKAAANKIKTFNTTAATLSSGLKNLPAIGAAAFVGWEVGRLIGDVTGLDTAIQNLLIKMDYGVTPAAENNSKAFFKLKQGYELSVTELYKLEKQHESFVEVLKAVESGQIKAKKRTEEATDSFDGMTRATSKTRIKLLSFTRQIEAKTVPALEDMADILDEIPEGNVGVSESILQVANDSEASAEIIASAIATAGAMAPAVEDMYKKFGEGAYQWAKEHEEAINKIVGTTFDIMGQIDAIIRMSHENKLAQYDIEYEKEKEKIEKSKMSEEEKAIALEKLDEKYDKKRREIQIKQAKADKAVALMAAIVNTAQGVTKALGGATPPLNFVLAALVGALGAVQIALIASQPIPRLARGAIFKKPTMYRGALVGEAGDEVLLPLDRVPEIIHRTLTTSNTINNYAARKQVLQVNVQIGTEVLKKQVVDIVNWGFRTKQIKVPIGATA